VSLDKANEILDAVRAGVFFPLHIINLALIVTGDLATTKKEKLWHPSTK
jgi:hypothetical protein